MVAEHLVTGDRKFQTAGAMMLKALDWNIKNDPIWAVLTQAVLGHSLTITTSITKHSMNDNMHGNHNMPSYPSNGLQQPEQMRCHGNDINSSLLTVERMQLNVLVRVGRHVWYNAT